MYSSYYSPYLILCVQILTRITATRITSSMGKIERVYETLYENENFRSFNSIKIDFRT